MAGKTSAFSYIVSEFSIFFRVVGTCPTWIFSCAQIAKALERPRLPDCIRRGTVVVCYSGQTFVVAKVYPPRCPLAVLCDVHDPHPVG